MEAKIAIWIVSEPRPEHDSAITWLNASSSADFYLLKLETIKIGDSDPALLLTLIVGPSEETKAIGIQKREFSERHHIRHEFWTQLLEYAKVKTTLHATISPSTDNWISADAGKTGMSFNYVV